ncbi:hypothetical protein NKR19_g914 [Coniochaeta hoffmannii]|uniref:Uncharacterized protein n=1 Tax=Coniochaeta hoffmannii TaxID=91930 RepID=A0AA38S8D2_9PEZI|nr:hypothetical protein NKR19_g914 [Coniochaeta hoffmannii]
MDSSSRETPPNGGDVGRPGGAVKEKGKEKETASQDTTQGAGEDGSSMLSRITTSTVGLVNSMVSGTPSSSVLASAVSEKGSTSALAPGGSRTHHAEGSTQFRPDISGGPAKPFRASQAQSHVAAEEAAFSDFLDSTPVFQPSGASQMDDATWHLTSVKETGSDLSELGTITYSSVAEQEQHDGEAVVSLLLDSNEHLPDSLEDDLLSPEQRESLRKALFGQSSNSARENVDWNHVLNFIPDYLRGQEPNMDSYLDTGLADPAEAWDSWVGQWKEVLTRYQDEVWGDLESLVKEARQEVEQLAQAQKDELSPETPALRRLRAILGHLRG